MSAKTFDDVLARVRRTLGGDGSVSYWPDDELIDYIDEGQLEYCRKTGALRKQFPLVLKENQETYTLPPDVITILRMENQEGDQILPTSSDRIEMRISRFRGDTDTYPEYYFADLDGENSIRFYPRPNPSVEASRLEFDQAELINCHVRIDIPGTIYSISTGWETPNGIDVMVLTDTHIGRFTYIDGQFFKVGENQILSSINVSGTPTNITVNADESKVFHFGAYQSYFMIQDSSQDVYWMEISAAGYDWDLTKWTNATWTGAKDVIFFVAPPYTDYFYKRSNRGKAIFHTFNNTEFLEADIVANGAPSVKLTMAASQMCYYEVDTKANEATSYLIAGDFSSGNTGLISINDEIASPAVIDGADCYGVVRITSNLFIYNREGSLYVYNKSAGSTTDLGYDSYFFAYAARSTGESTGPLQYDGTHFWCLSDDASTVDRYDVDTTTGALSNPLNFDYTGTISPVQDSHFFVIDGYLFVRQNDGSGYAISPPSPDSGAIVTIDSLQVDGSEAGAVVDIQTTDNDEIFVFDGEAGAAFEFVQDEDALLVWATREPVEGVLEITEPLALEYYALYKAYQKDAEQSHLAKSEYYYRKYRDMVAREKSKRAGAYVNKSAAVQGYYY